MSSVKEEAHKLIDGLPDDATWDDVEDQVLLRRKIEDTRRQVAAGDTLTTDEVKARLAKWLTSSKTSMCTYSG